MRVSLVLCAQLACLSSGCARPILDGLWEEYTDGAVLDDGGDPGFDGGGGSDGGSMVTPDAGGGMDAAGPADGDAPCPDGDDDGVCDEADNCPTTANADQADADDDGVGDACDTPTSTCAPESIGSQVMVGDISVSNVSLNGQGNAISVSPGAEVQVTARVEFSSCPNPIPSGVPYFDIGLEGDLSCLTPTLGACSNFEGSFRAPNAPGLYYVDAAGIAGLVPSCPNDTHVGSICVE